MVEIFMWDLSREDEDEVDLHYSYDMARRIEEEEDLVDPKIVFFEVQEFGQEEGDEDERK